MKAIAGTLICSACLAGLVGVAAGLLVWVPVLGFGVFATLAIVVVHWKIALALLLGAGHLLYRYELHHHEEDQ